MKYQFVEVIAKFITSISAGTPASPSTGQIWFDSTANKFRGQKTASIVDMEGGGGGSTLTIDGGASASTYVTAENIDGGNSIS